MNEKIDKLNANTSHCCKKSTFVTVAWCITRPSLWFSIEPIENINQFQRVVTNIWAKFLPDNQYYQFVIQARLQGRYEDVTEWPKVGTETYLKQLNNKDIHRCIEKFLWNYLKNLCFNLKHLWYNRRPKFYLFFIELIKIFF